MSNSLRKEKEEKENVPNQCKEAPPAPGHRQAEAGGYRAPSWVSELPRQSNCAFPHRPHRARMLPLLEKLWCQHGVKQPVSTWEVLDTRCLVPALLCSLAEPAQPRPWSSHHPRPCTCASPSPLWTPVPAFHRLGLQLPPVCAAGGWGVQGQAGSLTPALGGKESALSPPWEGERFISTPRSSGLNNPFPGT